MSLRVLALAESDSYLKWAVTLLAQLPPGSDVDVVIACSPIRPSVGQLASALSGTAFAGRRLDVVSPGQLLRRVEDDRPDAVVIACAGPSAHAYSDALSRSAHRPVLLAGIPGIALPARRKAWGFRGAIDLLVVHSHREVEEYELVRLNAGKAGRIGLATIPFLADSDAATPATATPEPRNRVVFATQGKVPRLRRERSEILLALDRLSANRPDLDVVVKTRGVPGEFHTHYENHHYEGIWAELVAAGRVHDPVAVRFATGPMAEHLRHAAALVTVSSTAVLEAMALDVPVLLIDEYGVSDRLINEVFLGSGCLAGLDAVAQAQFRHPERWWLRDNYFHPDADNTWTDQLVELVELARAGALPALADGLDPGRSRRRRRRDRLRLTPLGSALVRARQRARTWLPARLATRQPRIRPAPPTIAAVAESS